MVSKIEIYLDNKICCEIEHVPLIRSWHLLNLAYWPILRRGLPSILLPKASALIPVLLFPTSPYQLSLSHTPQHLCLGSSNANTVLILFGLLSPTPAVLDY